MTEFAPLDAAIAKLTERMSPASRKALAGRIATDLRSSNAARMKANVQPDGTPMDPRKAKPTGRGRKHRLRDQVPNLKKQVKAGKMFLRAAGPRYLRKESSADEAQVGFVGAMARIMRVHQLGLRDTVTRDPKSPEVTYPARVVIGDSQADRAQVLDRVADHLEL